MERLRIYADFNGIQSSPRNLELLGVPLDTYGSLRDLTNAGVRLKEEMQLIIADWSDDEEDLEGHCKVYYDWQRKFWWAELDEQGVLYVPRDERKPVAEFLCLGCRNNLEDYFSQHGRNPETKCPSCGTLIIAAVAPPENEANAKRKENALL